QALSSPPKLFGTDGVRGIAGEFLTAELALALGRAAATISPADTPQLLIVRDTRESGEMLEAALAAGIAAAGGHALLGGVLPTPGAAMPAASAASSISPDSRVPRPRRTRGIPAGDAAAAARPGAAPRSAVGDPPAPPAP